MRTLLLLGCFIHACMNGMQNDRNVITCAILQKLMNEFIKQTVEYRSSNCYRKASGGNEWRRAESGIVGKYSKNNTLEFLSIPEEGQIIELTLEDDGRKYIVFPDGTKWKYWLDEELERWVFMKDHFEVLPRARYTKVK